ncbi:MULTISPECIES: ABC transporter ATP-binding protein [Clostridia]|uniref:ABC transporter ATP-binding protein n=2 Tax=Clostridia TaxID=186801 RepID=A0A8I0A4V6_9CLOT|nr:MULTISPECIES: ABC transporter ATP-binding protein [Clostridia]MBC5640063.1 ABC transporter ATP-binding protein [Clostridium lentum]MBC5654283.1 ABC transporter ATP-binding protein [Blautia lenta]
MNIEDYNDNVSLKDVVKAVKMIPKTIKLIKQVHKKSFFIIIFLSIILGICPIFTLFGSQYLLNMITTKDFNRVLAAFIFYICANLFSDTIGSIMEYYQNKFQTLINYKLNYKIMNKCIKLSLKDFEDSETYDKLQRVQSETSYRPYQVFLSILNLITSMVTLFSSVSIIINWKPWVLLILVLIPITFSVYFFKIGQREFNINWERATDKRKSWYLSYLVTRDNTFKEIKSYGIGQYVLNKFDSINSKFVKQDIKLFKRRSIFTFIFEFVQQACTSIILFIIIYSALIGEILIGNVVGFINALNLIQNNCKEILNTVYTLYENNLYISQLFQFLDLEEENFNIENKELKNISDIETLDIKNLTFKYPNSPNVVLNNINLNIKKGERVAIVGANGSGKSTLVKLISKLYEVKENSILYNGISLNNYNEAQLKNCIAVLFQDFTKYEMTVRENVGFGNIESIDNDENMKKALDKASATFISNLDEQLGLWFQDGRQLSGGQWQKIAIARTFFRDASLYILDEPSSALDPIAEKEVIDMFLKMTEDKIGIFISHRLSTAMLADRIIVMNEGEIVGNGTHQELIKNNFVYKKMYELEGIKQDKIVK